MPHGLACVVRDLAAQKWIFAKALLEESGLSREVDISVHDGTLVIAAAGRAQQGWDEAFRRMVVHGDDELLDGDVETSEVFDQASWMWK